MSYDVRIGAAAALMAGSFLTVALGGTLGVQLFGVGLCSLQAGGWVGGIGSIEWLGIGVDTVDRDPYIHIHIRT
jgi:hypothetical protein